MVLWSLLCDLFTFAARVCSVTQLANWNIPLAGIALAYIKGVR